ncbi:hypothetical protein T12_7189 [Trichinella patagoniensis]|uniref:Uncharacterized protein n=1 Tax=Trichinella patagoniensis TaxID=990121 RepID=A0A0V0Z2M7_9BILA|nr:hypothetical protein T12_7189 [Trichinella patagoniensis]
MPIRTSINNGVPCRCPISGSVGVPSESPISTDWILPQTRGIASACTRVLASVLPELPTAPSQNSTLLHLHSGPTRPPRVVKRQRSWGPVSPRTSVTSFRMKETSAPLSKRQFTNTWFPSGPYARARTVWRLPPGAPRAARRPWWARSDLGDRGDSVVGDG